MNKSIVILSMALMALPAAAKHKKHKKKEAMQAAGTDILSVSMRRTACFGKCPDYTIEIKKDGTATFTGRYFTPDTGTFTKNIGAAKAAEVLDQFALYRVDTCKNQYTNKIPDLPGIIYNIKYRDSTKNINNAGFGPHFFKDLAVQMDNAGKKTDDTWTKIYGVK